ncbi:hypothetical protein [Streptomyces liangshanensis]|uniref:hypothetical protein n=1 Tax=Streptomyces liangshanensis TaxID=2717324 RepID=UPI0036DB00A5
MRTVISRRSVGGRFVTAAVTGLVFLVATGCGGGGDDAPKEPEPVAGTQLCGGHALSADASRALKVITGESRFEPSGEEYTLARAAADLSDAYLNPRVYRGDACRIYTPPGTPDFELRITWRWVDGAPTDDLASKFTVLKMGELALAAADSANVQFGCRTDKFAGTATAAHILIDVARGGMPKPPEGDVEALKDAYATVAHSYSLAMAKELGCQKNGGLPDKVVLDPA